MMSSVQKQLQAQDKKQEEQIEEIKSRHQLIARVHFLLTLISPDLLQEVLQNDIVQHLKELSKSK